VNEGASAGAVASADAPVGTAPRAIPASVYALLEERGALLHPEAARYLAASARPLELLRGALSQNGHFLVTLDVLERATESVAGGRGAVPSPGVIAGTAVGPSHGPGGGAGAGPTAGPTSDVPRSPSSPVPKAEPTTSSLLLTIPRYPAPLSVDRVQPRSAAGRADANAGTPAARGADLLARPLLDPSLAQGPSRLVAATALSLGAVPAPSVSPIAAPSPVAGPGIPLPPASIPVDHRFEILRDVTGASTCTGEISDFTKLFNDRYKTLRRILRQRREMVGAMPIDRVPRGGGDSVRVIGIVNEVRTSKNGHRILEVEDDTGVVFVLAPASDPDLLELAETVAQDEVIGVVAKTAKPSNDPRSKGDLLILQDLVRPDVPVTHESPRAQRPASVAFVGDFHFGSRAFLADRWDRFVAWMNGTLGDAQQQALAARVRYLVVNGDVCDGIGIYPGQEGDLAIPDVFEQYRFAGEQLARLPSRVKIFVLPGAHDAVRPAEPQPALGETLRKTFPSNVVFVGNPSFLSIEGVSILAYNGKGIDDYVTTVKGLSASQPLTVMAEMLRRRHLCPMYAHDTPIAPEHRDHLVIDPIPDIFVTGHVHRAGIGSYRGITLVSSSCWQGQTNRQKMLGLQPEPARVPVVDLQTGKAQLLNFDQ